MIKDAHGGRISVRDVDRKHIKEFGKWFERHVSQMQVDGEHVNEQLQLLAMPPLRAVRCFKGYIVNGFRFHTEDRERQRKTQNSGVFLTAETSSFASARDTNPMTGNVGYYGVLKDVIELQYIGGNRIVLFKCDWWDVTNHGGRGIKQDEYGFTCVNFTRTLNTNEPLILANQAQQVFYVQDTNEPNWHRPPDVSGEDWAWLVQYWGSPEVQVKSVVMHTMNRARFTVAVESFLKTGDKKPVLPWMKACDPDPFIRVMSPVADSSIFNGNLASAVNHLLHVPETIEKAMFCSRSHDKSNNQRMERIPVDILDTPKEYLFYMDVPGLSKSDIQSSGKRKREDGEDEGCKYIRLERNSAPKFMRKFKLPEDSDINKVSAKCENGVLSVRVERLPPPPESKTVEVTISRGKCKMLCWHHHKVIGERHKQVYKAQAQDLSDGLREEINHAQEKTQSYMVWLLAYVHEEDGRNHYAIRRGCTDLRGNDVGSGDIRPSPPVTALFSDNGCKSGDGGASQQQNGTKDVAMIVLLPLHVLVLESEPEHALPLPATHC
ncbi:class III heat shock protein [Cinnamomum micranthum f. kanehirae]|uniref:Class III heat shock protein n=1 Tax=Cinnamomum micranthum f. kanehirae TaxID=337451 RepID=A0A443PJ36_9MAGN|nr:class III heat shock protein [Cinnamomum micranthum f. kanehirae]